MRKIVEHVVQEKEEVQDYLEGREELTEYECYKTAVNHYKKHCFNWHQQEVHSQLEQASLSSFICMIYLCFAVCDVFSLLLQYEYALRHLYALVNLCQGGYQAQR